MNSTFLKEPRRLDLIYFSGQKIKSTNDFQISNYLPAINLSFVEIYMRELNMVEVASVSGAGVIVELVKSLASRPYMMALNWRLL